MKTNKKLLSFLHYTPNILEHIDLLFEKGGNIFIKNSSFLRYKTGIKRTYPM